MYYKGMVTNTVWHRHRLMEQNRWPTSICKGVQINPADLLYNIVAIVKDTVLYT